MKNDGIINQHFTHLFASVNQTWKICESGSRAPLIAIISKANTLKTTDLISINLFLVTHFFSSATYKQLGSAYKIQRLSWFVELYAISTVQAYQNILQLCRNCLNLGIAHMYKFLFNYTFSLEKYRICLIVNASSVGCFKILATETKNHQFHLTSHLILWNCILSFAIFSKYCST